MRYKKERLEPDNWKLLADIFSGLMLMFLLILMLIVLFVGYKDELFNANIAVEEDGTGYKVVISDGGDDGGDEEPEKEDKPITANDGLAAVKVVVVDGDTGDTVAEEGINFDLFAGRQGNQITLHSYYPTRTPFTEFKTISDGTFFLPEKVMENTYILKNLAAPDEYVSGESMAFTISGTYTWEEPYVVRFPLYVRKHSLAIRVTDKETGEPVPYGVYDISTVDGKSAGRITCDAEGYGISQSLPQDNEYVITQSKTAEFYAALDYPITVALDGKSDNVVDIQAVKTSFELYMTDELNKTPIQGIALEVLEGSTSLGEFKTNEKGIIKLEKLRKNAEYKIKQVSWADKWQKKAYETAFEVDGEGKINGQPVFSETGTNRMIRVNISAKSKILGVNISGEPLVLKTDGGRIVHQWSSEKEGTVIEGIEEGRYILERSGKESVEIDIKDIPEMQYFSYNTFREWLISLVLAGTVGILSAIAALIIIKRKSLKKEDDTDESEE